MKLVCTVPINFIRLSHHNNGLEARAMARAKGRTPFRDTDSTKSTEKENNSFHLLEDTILATFQILPVFQN
jgi:hypothetical protein